MDKLQEIRSYEHSLTLQNKFKSNTHLINQPQAKKEKIQSQEFLVQDQKGNLINSRIQQIDNKTFENQQFQHKTIKNKVLKNSQNPKNTQIAQLSDNFEEQNQKLKSSTFDSCQVNLSGDLSNQKELRNCPISATVPKNSSLRPRKTKQIRKYRSPSSDSQPDAFQFPFLNQYMESHSDRFLSTEQAIEKAKKQSQNEDNTGTFINCDVRYFNWELFIQQVGKFDVLIIDPPWRIKGAQQNDSQFMFSNCRFSLEYNTMSNMEIARIPLHLISDEGFIFLWILNSQMDASIEIMQQWGYELVDEVAWIKLRDNKIYLTHGYYFMHSYEICLIGYKNNKKNKSKQNRLTMLSGLSNNTIFADVRKKSQKPEDLYSIIEMMFPGKRKIQVFARNHNLKFGLFSIGNELGQSYQKWNLNLNCDSCSNPIQFGTKRYKSKLQANYDLCQKCIPIQKKSQFFQISNQVDEDIRHEYVSCDHCGVQPIWGMRFQCITCNNYDICQNCYDKNLQTDNKFHSIQHQFRFLEIPVFGNGFPIHQVKCFSCYQNPIVGAYFNCMDCKNYKQCQKCYFERRKGDTTPRTHKPDHHMEMFLEPQIDQNKLYECFACKVEILQDCHMCENCYNFFFCQKCFEKRDSFKSLYANNHKKYHVFTKIF